MEDILLTSKEFAPIAKVIVKQPEVAYPFALLGLYYGVRLLQEVVKLLTMIKDLVKKEAINYSKEAKNVIISEFPDNNKLRRNVDSHSLHLLI